VKGFSVSHHAGEIAMVNMNGNSIARNLFIKHHLRNRTHGHAELISRDNSGKG
jgi:hypothetical protein